MAGMSPLLQNSLGLKTSNQDKKQNLDNRHEKIYQDLQKRAHEAKPNEAKAVMVNEGILGNPITDTVDFFKDGANFVKAVKDGTMGDNNLGRINDFGLKIGAALIATFLAAHSKTKKDTIMRFFGGAMFIAAMDLWPKLFINLPAKLVHGFRIDRKYISAQGDKKDFFLDNQFLVWDAYPEEQLRKDAKNAGIDYDSENGKEKIQRKMQKTALQNRTLWMATAGFATPLMTAMTCNFVEPFIEKAIVNHDVKKVKNVFASQNGLADYMKAAAQKAKASDVELKALDDIFAAYKAGKMPLDSINNDNSLFSQLANKFSLARLADSLKDSDDSNPLNEYSLGNLKAVFKNMHEANGTIDKKSIEEGIDSLNRLLRKDGFPEIDGAQQKTLFDSIGADFSIANVKKHLKSKELGLNDKDIAFILEKSKVDEKKFFDQVKKYYTSTFAKLEAQTKAYLDLINPVVGSKAESLQTLEFNKTMKETFKALGITDKELKEITKSLKVDDEAAKGISGKIISLLAKKISALGEKDYEAALKKLPASGFDKETTDLIAKFANKENIGLIGNVSQVKDGEEKAIIKAILGISDDTKGTANGNKDGLISVFEKFIRNKGIDIEAIKTKAILATNFERRLKAGDFDKLSAGQLEAARKIMYDGSISVFENKANLASMDDYLEVVEAIFDEKAFEVESKAIKDIDVKETVSNLKRIAKYFEGATPTEKYFACGSFANHIKKFATSMGNNKAWMKIFAPMSIALVAITLLVQPLFGKIDKEFPEEGKGGAK